MSYSAEVEAIQKALNAVNIPVEVDGIFGEETENGVLLFQRSYTPSNNTHKDYQIGIVDGVVGKKTLLALDEALMEGWKYETIVPEGPIWLKTAKAELGTLESKSGSNPEVEKYLRSTWLPSTYKDDTAWCASFVGWVF